MANKIISLSDGTNDLYPKIAQTVNMDSAGTQTFSLTSAKGYLLIVTRNNSADTGKQGMYLVQANTNACVKTISASSVATVSISGTTLSVTTSDANVHLSLMPIYV